MQAEAPAFALLLLVVIDIILGLLCAYGAKVLSSTISFIGMVKKAAMILLIMAAVIVTPFAGGTPVGALVAISFIVTEGLSIAETCKKLGIKVPKPLADALIKSQDRNV
jgi:toxin secretion/phage lysis holin